MLRDPPLCNECRFYLNDFPGHCRRVLTHRMARERQQTGRWERIARVVQVRSDPHRCGIKARHFKPKGKPGDGAKKLGLRQGAKRLVCDAKVGL